MTEAAVEYWYLHQSHEPVRGASPAAGSPFTQVVPGSVEWELMSVTFTFTAAVAVATRIPRIAFLDYGGESFCTVGMPFGITASNVSSVTFAQEIAQFGAANSAHMGAPIPPLRLGDGLSFQVTADAIAAADTITKVAFFVKQWPVRID